MPVLGARPSTSMRGFVRVAIGVFAALALVGILIVVAFRVSPWPSVLLIRRSFDQEAERVSRALERHVPKGVSERLDQRYDTADRDALLDVFHPPDRAGAQSPLVVVWVHGGGWVSGSKRQIANYARILAGRGLTVVGVDYTVAPGGTYPKPVRQVNAALAYLIAQADRLGIDASRLVLAGDSGGAHIVAQLANVLCEPSYAAALGIAPSIECSRLRGLVLFCGAYDTRRINLEGPFGGFLRTVLWSYSGGRDFQTSERFATSSVIEYVTPNFPPAFISAGNADPLAPQSRAFADVLARHGVLVDTLFFPPDHVPALGHEYQFDLDTDAGHTALERCALFLAGRAETE